MKYLEKFVEKYMINIYLISAIIFLIGIVFSCFNKNDISLAIIEFSIRIFAVLMSLATIDVLLNILIDRIKKIIKINLEERKK